MIAVSRETQERLRTLEALVLAETERQNLISPSTIDLIRPRHIDDSLQLLDHIAEGPLVDIGTGAGFPGLVLACCRPDATHLVEPRTKRAAFLTQACDTLGLQMATVWACRIERVDLPPVATITARAVASLDILFGIASHLATPATRWVLSKGRSAQSELDAARSTWQGEFELVPSLTDPESAIVLATQVSRRRMS